MSPGFVLVFHLVRHGVRLHLATWCFVLPTVVAWVYAYLSGAVS